MACEYLVLKSLEKWHFSFWRVHRNRQHMIFCLFCWLLVFVGLTSTNPALHTNTHFQGPDEKELGFLHQIMALLIAIKFHIPYVTGHILLEIDWNSIRPYAWLVVRCVRDTLILKLMLLLIQSLYTHKKHPIQHHAPIREITQFNYLSLYRIKATKNNSLFSIFGKIRASNLTTWIIYEKWNNSNVYRFLYLKKSCLISLPEKKISSLTSLHSICICVFLSAKFLYLTIFFLKADRNFWHYSFINKIKESNRLISIQNAQNKFATNNLIGFYLCMCACLICDSQSLIRCSVFK